MSIELENKVEVQKALSSDCTSCFGLCCVALPYAKSADFAFDKDGGTPCRNLQDHYLCGIHDNLIQEGFRGCVAYECFGAGQKVSRIIYKGKEWKGNKQYAEQMFSVYPIVQQLHEMLSYLYEAMSYEETKSIHTELREMFRETEKMTEQSPEEILHIDIAGHRAKVNMLLLQTSELVRPQITHKKKRKYSSDYIGAKLRKAKLKGENLRGALLIAADLREADLRFTDLIGADFRDADLSGADLTGSLFLTQAQVNAAKGNSHTKLPPSLKIPDHWKKRKNF
ncbi:pentapeptide repeat-containing protein [Priestia endophytica]|uniref:pentapeptide repeat-containing protein n=1 Tax=Priestia endophytica TaxID=135735 RepID=UPI001F5B1A5D|nr:pentapeptide repeat-containing protein [Priestia endophytica]